MNENNEVQKPGYGLSGFTCEICNGTEPKNKHSSSYNQSPLPICDECKSLLRELVSEFKWKKLLGI